jgi:hypothetical protein
MIVFGQGGSDCMKSPQDPREDIEESISSRSETPRQQVNVRDVLDDLRAGLRTRAFLTKYGITLPEFEDILKSLIRKGVFSKEDFQTWKEKKRSAAETSGRAQDNLGRDPGDQPSPAKRQPSVATYVIENPEENKSWALQLFSTDRDRMTGAQFKVNLHGKKYFFVVEKMLFRGSVEVITNGTLDETERKKKRDEAMEYITRHGWAAYLENRAFSANFGAESGGSGRKARLVLLHCRNQTFLAALHTPAPAINLYVGNSLENIRQRLAKSVDLAALKI